MAASELSACPAASLLALAEMLGGGGEEAEEEEREREREEGPKEALGGLQSPSGIGAAPRQAAEAPPATMQVKPRDHKEIWAAEEVLEGSEYEDSWDLREQPEYEILFRQQVGAEDLFLGMSRKDPSTACCEDMLVKIKLPDTKTSDITLDIREKVLDLRSPQKKLLLHLPHPVDTQSGKACFLPEKGLLEVALRMKREFDFINFA